MLKTILAMSFIAGMMLLPASAQIAEHFLDLIGVPSIEGTLVPIESGKIPSGQRLGPGTVAYSSQGPYPRSPYSLRVTLLDFDRGSYGAREPFVYEVRLDNTGNREVLFPWSIDSSLFAANVPESYMVSLGLADAADPRSTGLTGLIMLYGAPSVPRSLETVLPGEFIRIRIKSDWLVFSEGTKRMRVVVQPSYRGLAYPEIIADNTIDIQSRGRTP